jgi:hypothetical protein
LGGRAPTCTDVRDRLAKRAGPNETPGKRLIKGLARVP